MDLQGAGFKQAEQLEESARQKKGIPRLFFHIGEEIEEVEEMEEMWEMEEIKEMEEMKEIKTHTALLKILLHIFSSQNFTLQKGQDLPSAASMLDHHPSPQLLR